MSKNITRNTQQVSGKKAFANQGSFAIKKPVGSKMFYFLSWKMIYSDSFTMLYTFMRSKTKFYRSKNDMMDKVLHF